MKAVAIAAALALAPSFAQDLRRSGFADMSPATQAMQRDDAQNPAFLWVQAGAQRFDAECRRCHEPPAMRGVAARYPAWDATLARGVTLGERIDQCRTRHVKAAPWGAESDERLAMEAWIGLQSRGLPIAPPADERLAPQRALGQRLWGTRFGQLDLACAECHDARAGGRLGGSTIPQGHPTGYPIYRLEWQGLGSLQRRLRNCMAGVRAEPFGHDAPEATALELFLMQRAAGMTVETPAVRP